MRRPRVQLLLCLVVLIAGALALSLSLRNQSPVPKPPFPTAIAPLLPGPPAPRRTEAWDRRGSLEAYRQALPLDRRLGNGRRELAALSQRSLALERLGALQGARDTYREAFELALRLADLRAALKVGLNLGLMELEIGEIGRALEIFEAIRVQAARHKEPDLEAAALNAAGRAHSRMGETAEAFNLHRQALSLFKELEDGRQVAVTLLHIADAYRESRQDVLAAGFYRRALDRKGEAALPPVDRARALNNLGIAAYRMNNFAGAEVSYRRALTTFDGRNAHGEQAVALTNLGWLDVSRGHPEAAMTAFERALPTALLLEHRPTQAAIYLGMASAERLRNRPLTAQRHAEQALGLVESLRTTTEERELRVSFLAGRQNFYGLLIDLLMERHRLEPAAGYDVAAFEISERSRSRGLMDSLGGEVLTLRQIQAEVLEPGTVLLEYFFGETRSYVWVVTPSSFASFELAGWQEIHPLARDLQRLLPKSHRREEKAEATAKAVRLSRHLMGPVIRHLGTEHRIILLVGPPILQTLPFAALPDFLSAPNPEEPWSAPLLVRYQFVHQLSASVLAALQRRRSDPSQRQGLLAVVFPRTRRFKPLPYTRQEAESIARTARAQGMKTLVLQQAEARKDRVLGLLREPFEILHFAVHGDPDAAAPERSALVLSELDARGRSIDPYLQARDIETVTLHAELVVLSACGTGLGREIDGEGLTGLTQAFFRAGAPRLIASLWDVEDDATALLMERFYENLLTRKLPPAAALREAQLAIWRQHGELRYWGGFVFQGDWE